MDYTTHSYFMKEAIKEAKKALLLNEVPVGAIIVDENFKIIARGYNTVEKNNKGIKHAEINVLLDAMDKLNKRYLNKFSLYVTLEPCLMCAGVIANSRVGKVIFGAMDKKAGAVMNGLKTFDHKNTIHKPIVIGGIMKEECSDLLINFFKDK